MRQKASLVRYIRNSKVLYIQPAALQKNKVPSQKAKGSSAAAAGRIVSLSARAAAARASVGVTKHLHSTFFSSSSSSTFPRRDWQLHLPFNTRLHTIGEIPLYLVLNNELRALGLNERETE
jgi:hypothetical protein